MLSSTKSPVASDAYLEGYDLLLTLYPGAVAAFDSAISADAGFAAAYIGKARAQQFGGDMPSARATLAAVQALPTLTEPDLMRIKIFDLMFTGQNDAALTAVRQHVNTWPRDALILGTSTNQLGLIGLSGRAGREHELVEFLRGFANAL